LAISTSRRELFLGILSALAATYLSCQNESVKRMTTTAIGNACVAGAMAGLLAGRFVGSITPTDYSALANAAAAISVEFLAENAALAVPMTDTDVTGIHSLVKSVTYGCIANGGYVSVTAADYLPIAKQIAAASKQAVSKLTNAGLPPYLGAIATRASVPNNFGATTANYTNRTFHITTDTVTSLQVAWANVALATNTGEHTAGTMTTKGQVEYPVGVYHPLTWSAADHVVAAPGAMPLSDTLTIAIPSGTGFWIESELTGSVNLLYTDATQKSTANGDAQQSGGTDMTNVVDNTGNVTFPSLIVGMTTKRTALGVGDSRFVGFLYDQAGAGTNGNNGDFQSAFSPNYGGTRYGCVGETAATFNGNHALAVTLAAYHTDLIHEFGINDLNAGTSAASLETTTAANLAIFTALGLKAWLTTIQPSNTSSDEWETLINQTLNAHDAARVTYNTAIRSNTIAGASGFFEYASLVESSLNSGKWAVNGTAFWYTGDGTHLNNTSTPLAGPFVLT
jgi:hypothetical protein